MTADLPALFRNKDLLKQVLLLSHKGRAATYERLEFLGDRVLGLLVAEMLYAHFPNEKEGDLAKRFVALVRAETLAGVAQSLGIPQLLKTPDQALRQNTSVLSDVCEALLGALYLDGGLGAVRDFAAPLFLPLMRADRQAPQDAKTSLQEWAQHAYQELPRYTLQTRAGADHQPLFRIKVAVKDHAALGEGSSKKAAEQDAARNLLEELNA